MEGGGSKYFINRLLNSVKNKGNITLFNLLEVFSKTNFNRYKRDETIRMFMVEVLKNVSGYASLKSKYRKVVDYLLDLFKIDRILIE